MRRSIFLLLAAIISTLIGVISLSFPDKMAEGFGVTPNPVIVFLARELGVFNLCLGVLNFLVRNDPDSKTLKAIFVFNFAYHLMMMPVNIIGLSQSVFTFNQALLPMVFHLLMGLGSFIYLSRIKNAAS